jgi:hypothetical protein
LRVLSDKPAAVRKRHEREREAQGISLAHPRLGPTVWQALEIDGLYDSAKAPADRRARQQLIDDAATIALERWAAQVFSSRVTLIATGHAYPSSNRKDGGR